MFFGLNGWGMIEESSCFHRDDEVARIAQGLAGEHSVTDGDARWIVVQPGG